MRFGFSTIMLLSSAGGMFFAAHAQDLAAFYIAVIGPAILGTVHVIEVKLNRLLDAKGIRVDKDEIDNS